MTIEEYYICLFMMIFGGCLLLYAWTLYRSWVLDWEDYYYKKEVGKDEHD